ncbi:DUF2744 domain-containing protein [Rhodococcus sp. NPDC019627]|uniref:phage gene 29 protein family protein n=1 Tax=unclassified Rhodococcus (in: high G+C Gram-positive bacteria) TaxID=192944 RepID=UPI003407E6FE
MRFPTYEDCQPAEGEEPDPRQVFQWFLNKLPLTGDEWFTVEPNIRPDWSKLFWDLGLRHHPELQTKKILAPHRGQQHSLNGSATVVGIDEPDSPPMVIQDPALLTAHEQAVQLERYRQLGRLPEMETGPAGASVEYGEEFNPADHTVNGVNCYLLAPIPMTEKRRVMAAEMTGKARQGILNNPKNRGI